MVTPSCFRVPGLLACAGRSPLPKLSSDSRLRQFHSTHRTDIDVSSTHGEFVLKCAAPLPALKRRRCSRGRSPGDARHHAHAPHVRTTCPPDSNTTWLARTDWNAEASSSSVARRTRPRCKRAYSRARTVRAADRGAAEATVDQPVAERGDEHGRELQRVAELRG